MEKRAALPWLNLQDPDESRAPVTYVWSPCTSII